MLKLLLNKLRGFTLSTLEAISTFLTDWTSLRSKDGLATRYVKTGWTSTRDDQGVYRVIHDFTVVDYF